MDKRKRPVTQMVLNVYPLFKGSRNPPLEEEVLLRTAKTGEWGIGRAVRLVEPKAIGFLFRSHSYLWVGEPKSSFSAWMYMPATQPPQNKAQT